jgi:peptide/nickel transport system substrate-binding protein
MRSRSALAVLLAALLVMLAVPVSLQAASPSPTAEDTVLRIGVTEEPNTASVLQCCTHYLELVLGYDPLVGKDKLGQPVPAFAESWSVSDDGLTWTFKIRPGMTWSDGTPADANDAAFTFNYMLESADSAAAICGMWCVFDFNASIVSAAAPDAETLTLTLSKPSNFPLYGRFYVIPEHVFKDVKYEDLATFQAEPPIVGSGPFILTEWVHGQYQRLVRNDGYWGGKPGVSEILLQFYKTQDAAIAALRSGEIDFTDAVSLTALKDLAADPTITVADAPWSYFTPLVFNTRGAVAGPGYPGGPEGPGASTDALADPAFRDALGYAIDHQALVDRVLDGHGEPGLGPVAPSDTGNYTGLPGVARTFDLEAAKSKLEAAGYTDSNGDGMREDKSGKALNLDVVIDGSNPALALDAQFLVEWFKQVGVGLTATALDGAAVGDKVYGNDFDLYVGNYLPNINNRFAYYATNNGDAGWVSPEYDDLWARLQAASDPAVIKDLTAQLDTLIYTEGPFNILYYPNLVQAYRTDKFTGWDRLGAPLSPVSTFDLYSAPTFAGLTLAAAAGPSASATAPSSSGATAAPTAAPGPSDTSGGSSMLPIAIGVIAVVAIGAFLIRRRRSNGTA